MTDATPPITPDEASRFAALAMALVAAQTEVASLVRDNSGQHGAYTSSDEVAFVARKALTNNGLAWIRLRVDLEAGKLDTCELGNQYYVGDVVESWVLIHVEGGRLEGSTRMPVISSKGRPQDKAVGASLTYDSGHTLRGLLCLDREDKNHAVDQRRDHDDGQGPAPKPKAPVKPKASKAFKAPEDPFLSKGSKPYTAITAQVKELATLLGEETGDVWAEALRRTAVPPRFDHGGKTIEVKGPGQLRSTQGRFVSVYLTKALGEAVAKAAREAAGEDDEPDFDEALDELDGLVGHPGAES